MVSNKLQDDDGSSGADTEEEMDDTTPSSGSVTVLSEKTLDNGQKVCVCVAFVLCVLHVHAAMLSPCCTYLYFY